MRSADVVPVSKTSRVSTVTLVGKKHSTCQRTTNMVVFPVSVWESHKHVR
jgi:hypothetical protein